MSLYSDPKLVLNTCTSWARTCLVPQDAEAFIKVLDETFNPPEVPALKVEEAPPKGPVTSDVVLDTK